MTDRVFLCTTADLMNTFGCSDKTVRNLTDRKIVVRVGHGQYDYMASVRNYIEQETISRTRSGQRNIGEGNEEIERQILLEDLRRKKMINDEKDGTLIPLREIEPFFMETVGLFRRAVLDNHGVNAPSIEAAARRGGVQEVAKVLQNIDEEILLSVGKKLSSFGNGNASSTDTDGGEDGGGDETAAPANDD